MALPSLAGRAKVPERSAIPDGAAATFKVRREPDALQGRTAPVRLRLCCCSVGGGEVTLERAEQMGTFAPAAVIVQSETLQV